MMIGNGTYTAQQSITQIYTQIVVRGNKIAGNLKHICNYQYKYLYWTKEASR